MSPSSVGISTITRLPAAPPGSPRRVHAAIAGVSGALFALLTVAVVAHTTGHVDRDLIGVVRDWASPIVTAIMQTATLSSGTLAAPAALAIAFVLWRRLGRRPALHYAASCVTGLALDLVIKAAVQRPRPHGLSPLLTRAGWYAFPSGDAMFAAIAYGLGAVLLARTVRSTSARAAVLAGGAAIVVLDGVARVYLGAHWPTDVVGGVLAGTATGALWLGAPGLVAAGCPLAEPGAREERVSR